MFILWSCVLWNLLRGHLVNGLKLDWQHSARRERSAIKKCTYGRTAVPDEKTCFVTSIPQILCLRAPPLSLSATSTLCRTQSMLWSCKIPRKTNLHPTNGLMIADVVSMRKIVVRVVVGGLCADGEQLISHSKSWLFSPFLSIFHHTPLFCASITMAPKWTESMLRAHNLPLTY